MVEMSSEIRARQAAVALDEREYRGCVLGVSMAEGGSPQRLEQAQSKSEGCPTNGDSGPARGSFGDRGGLGPRGALFYIEQ
jgi:hypothetical protein